jgi:hypothetical protein
MKYLIAALFSLVVCFVSLAQDTQGSVPTQHFIITANAAGYGGNQAVSIVGAGFQLTKYVSVAYGRISNPMDTQKPIYNIGDLNVTYELGDLLPKKVKSSLVFDTTNWLVTFQGSAGKVSAPGVDRIAEGLGVYLSRPVANNVQMTCGYRFLHGAGLGTTWVKVPSVGLNFTF